MNDLLRKTVGCTILGAAHVVSIVAIGVMAYCTANMSRIITNSMTKKQK